MGTAAVGRNRAGSKVGPESAGGGMVPRYDNGCSGLVLIDSKTGCGPRLVGDVGNTSEAEIQEPNRVENWNKYDNGRSSVKIGCETRMGSQVKTRAVGRDMEGKVQSGAQIENVSPAVNKDSHRGGTRGGEKTGRGVARPEHITESIASTVTDIEKRVVPEDPGMGRETKPEIEDSGNEVKTSSRQMENTTRTETEVVAKVNDGFGSALKSRVEAKVETELWFVPTSEPEPVLECNETGSKSNTETGLVTEAQTSTKTTDEAPIRIGDITETSPADQTLDIDQIVSSHMEKASRAKKSKSSKSCSRTRPGTATGLRPGVVSPRLSRGLADLESTTPTEGIESTWPRRIMVRKRTVRQGGALHNLPILPPLPAVLSALEKRRPNFNLHSRHGHFSENLLSMESTCIVGRFSLKEPPTHQDLGASLVGRASLKEQNLEHWRICRDQEEPERSRSREKQQEQGKEKGKEERREKERKKEKRKMVENIGKENEKVTAHEETKQEKFERRIEEKAQENGSKLKEKDEETQHDLVENIRIKDGLEEQNAPEFEEVVVKLQKEDREVEGGEEGTFVEERGMESWDTVLDMVNTLWEDDWEKGGAGGGGGGGGGDTDSFSGSLQRWPLLRPPMGFGGSHPPSSAASEISLTELERRARELDSDLEHLDLSQPHRDPQDLFQTLLEPQRERADMYQTHPGPQREKAALLTGVGSRSQVSLELSVTDTEKPTIDWSTKSAAGTSTGGTSSIKEDSSPDSNLTLESDSSGVFLSNQSQEEAGSDSDQPISGSDLGSSSTSLEKDGDDGVLKEWGREESAELQWCYPSLLDSSSQQGDLEGEREADVCGSSDVRGKDGFGGKGEVKAGVVSIIHTPLDHTDTGEDIPPRKKVTLMGIDSPLSLSPSNQPIKHLLDPNYKPIRSSGLDCGDLDPFVQSDSFVYLAVSARPGSRSENPTVVETSTNDTKQDGVRQHLDGRKTHLEQSGRDLDPKMTHLAPQKPEGGDFLCTDSFVYLAAPDCLLLGPEGTSSYSGRESDSESSGSDPVDMSVLGCGSVVGDSDWDSDLSDSDPSRSSRNATAAKPAGLARPRRLSAEPGWDLFGETTEPELLSELFTERSRSANGMARTVAEAGVAAETQSDEDATTAKQTEPPSSTMTTTKKVTWQFKPAQRSVCTGSRKEKEKESSSLAMFTEPGGGGGESRRPSPSSSSSSSPSSSSSSG